LLSHPVVYFRLVRPWDYAGSVAGMELTFKGGEAPAPMGDGI